MASNKKCEIFCVRCDTLSTVRALNGDGQPRNFQDLRIFAQKMETQLETWVDRQIIQSKMVVTRKHSRANLVTAINIVLVRYT